MSEIQVITAALAAGAIAFHGVIDQASRDAYQALKSLVRDKLANYSTSEVVLTEYEREPQVWETPLTHLLSQADAGNDEEILEASRKLLEKVRPKQFASGEYIIQTAGDVQNVLQGEHQHVVINYGDAKDGRPMFAVTGGSVTHNHDMFKPGRKIEQIDGDKLQSIDWRWCGPRFNMPWQTVSAYHLKGTLLAWEFKMADITSDPEEDWPDIGINQIGLKVRFNWRGTTGSELHRFELNREHDPVGPFRFNLGKEIFPPILK